MVAGREEGLISFRLPDYGFRVLFWFWHPEPPGRRTESRCTRPSFSNTFALKMPMNAVGPLIR
jgi:hypothetical protein